MDVGDLLAKEAPRATGASEGRPSSRQHSTRHSLLSQTSQYHENVFDGAAAAVPRAHHDALRPSRTKQQKHVTFELLLPEGHNRENRARLPMRVMISPHDTTDSIITTVRNFYGLYEGPGVSFQDKEGRILIATFENFEHNMVVYVRMTAPDPAVVAAAASQVPSATTSPRKPMLAAAIDMRPPSRNSRPASRAAAPGRSLSPQSNRSHRSMSKPQSRSGFRPKEKENLYDDMYAGDTDYDSDGAHSRRSKIEPLASAEISVENIVEGGRRKRAKFDSSELPLFVPPQVPATNSISSVSPQRRPAASGDVVASPPFSWSNQRNITYQQPLPSPQSYTGYYSNTHTPYNNPNMRSRAVPTFQPRSSVGGGAILPTPEPTNASVISDEDVALQLMRLGDASNFSHGRTSTSTMDDGLSGKADAASSAGEESDVVDDEAAKFQQPISHVAGPRSKKQRVPDEALPSTDNIHSSGDDYSEADSDVPEYDERGVHIVRATSKPKTEPNAKPRGSVSSVNGSTKSTKSRAPGPLKSKPKTNSVSAKVPMSPASLPSQSRKTSTASTINFQHQLGIDEEDLSTKPRCQRCRKSKKGCDRQRPCGRCKDAGIGIEGCVSEDEGNGRKGRYGRHMGVPVKKSDPAYDTYDAVPLTAGGGEFLAPALPDKNKKKKR